MMMSEGSSRKKSTSAGRGNTDRSRGKNQAQHRAGQNASRKVSSGAGQYKKPASTAGRKRSRGRKKGPGSAAVIGGVIVLVLAVSGAGYMVKNWPTARAVEGSASESGEMAQPLLDRAVTVDGISITGLSKADAKQLIMKQYPWSMKVVLGDSTYEVPDLAAGQIDVLLDEIYSKSTAGDSEKEDGKKTDSTSGQNSSEAAEAYTFTVTGLEEAARAEAANVAAQWDRPAKNGSITSYDKATDTFVVSGEEKGIIINQEQVASDILNALSEKQFGAVITAATSEAAPEISGDAASKLYKTIATFTTKTTSNSARNTNIKLSADALNGTIVQPGEEFSFNETVGQRTAKKGYKGAAAYSNGEVVQEIGGGVCQLSTTLYNATIGAGLEISKRQSHTFEPSYITPGQDATVSWDLPDFRFKNNSSSAIGIRASFSKQVLTVSIYGIPILEEGVTHSLKSRKLADLGVPAPTYVEDPTLQPGVEVTRKGGSRGSSWETRLVVTKNGEVVSQEVDHTVTYKGHAPVVARNTSGVAPETSIPETIPVPSETPVPETSGVAGPGAEVGPGVTEPSNEGPGPGMNPGPSPTAAPTAAPTTAPTVAPTTTPTAAPTAAAVVPEIPDAGASDTGGGAAVVPSPY